ncbi:hypothetical protein GCM10020295_62780 [Streptomyces cinereospinus]
MLGGDGRGEAAAEVLQGAALAEPRPPELPLGTVRDPGVPGGLHMGGGERGAVPGQQQTREDRVLGVVGARRAVGDVSGDAAEAGADLGGLHVLGGGAQGVADGQAEQGAAGPGAEFSGVPGGRDRGNAGDRWHRGLSSRVLAEAPRGLARKAPLKARNPLRNSPPVWCGAQPPGAQRHPVDM